MERRKTIPASLSSAVRGPDPAASPSPSPASSRSPPPPPERAPILILPWPPAPPTPIACAPKTPPATPPTPSPNASMAPPPAAAPSPSPRSSTPPKSLCELSSKHNVEAYDILRRGCHAWQGRGGNPKEPYPEPLTHRACTRRNRARKPAGNPIVGLERVVEWAVSRLA